MTLVGIGPCRWIPALCPADGRYKYFKQMPSSYGTCSRVMRPCQINMRLHTDQKKIIPTEAAEVSETNSTRSD